MCSIKSNPKIDASRFSELKVFERHPAFQEAIHTTQNDVVSIFESLKHLQLVFLNILFFDECVFLPA